jgi:hypothetical protein
VILRRIYSLEEANREV